MSVILKFSDGKDLEWPLEKLKKFVMLYNMVEQTLNKTITLDVPSTIFIEIDEVSKGFTATPAHVMEMLVVADKYECEIAIPTLSKALSAKANEIVNSSDSLPNALESIRKAFGLDNDMTDKDKDEVCNLLGIDTNYWKGTSLHPIM